MYITQNGKYETQFIRVAVPVGTSASSRLKNATLGTKKKRANSFGRAAGVVLGRRPVAKVGHTDAKCT